MNRDIKFRGKRVDNGEWVEGSLVIDVDGKPWIIDYAFTDLDSYSWHEVTPSTVGQYSGLKDRNGSEIYDLDRVKRRVYLVEGKDYMDYNCDVKWNGWCFGLFIHDKQVWGLDPIISRGLEIIGSVSDNPELLNK